MLTEAFAEGNSLVHRMDPRLRVLFAGAFSFIIALTRNFHVMWAGLALAALMLALARLHPLLVLRRLLMVNTLVFFFWLILPLTYEGAPLFHIGPLAVTRPGVILSAQITLKSNAILIFFIALAATIPFSALGQALHSFRVPEKLVYMLMMTYRYIFVLEHEFQRLLRAAKIRGFVPETNLHTYRTYAYLIAMLFVRAASRADRVHDAMRCRGFNGAFHSLSRFTPNRLDWLGSALMTVALMGLLVLEWETAWRQMI